MMRRVMCGAVRSMQHSPERSALHATGRVRLTGAVYDLDTGRVCFFDPEPA